MGQSFGVPGTMAKHAAPGVDLVYLELDGYIWASKHVGRTRGRNKSGAAIHSLDPIIWGPLWAPWVKLGHHSSELEHIVALSVKDDSRVLAGKKQHPGW